MRHHPKVNCCWHPYGPREDKKPVPELFYCCRGSCKNVLHPHDVNSGKRLEVEEKCHGGPIPPLPEPRVFLARERHLIGVEDDKPIVFVYAPGGGCHMENAP